MTLPVAVWIVLSLIWGSTWLFVKVGLEDLPPLTFAGLRFAVGLIPLALIVIYTRTPIPRDRASWTLMVGTGFLVFTVTYGLVFWGQQYISSGLASLLFATFPLFGMVLAHGKLPEEPMTVPKIVGVLLGMTGVGIIFSDELAAHGTAGLLGSAAILFAALAAAYADVIIKARGNHLSSILLTAVQMSVGMITLLAIGITLEGNPLNHHWTARAVVSVLYLAIVGTSIAFVLLYWLFKHMEVTKTMLLTLVTPLIAVILGVVILGEGVSWRVAVGGVGILGGLGLVVRS